MAQGLLHPNTHLRIHDLQLQALLLCLRQQQLALQQPQVPLSLVCLQQQNDGHSDKEEAYGKPGSLERGNDSVLLLLLLLLVLRIMLLPAVMNQQARLSSSCYAQ
jgi:hypothetical protein